MSHTLTALIIYHRWGTLTTYAPVVTTEAAPFSPKNFSLTYGDLLVSQNYQHRMILFWLIFKLTKSCPLHTKQVNLISPSASNIMADNTRSFIFFSGSKFTIHLMNHLSVRANLFSGL